MIKKPMEIIEGIKLNDILKVTQNTILKLNMSKFKDGKGNTTVVIINTKYDKKKKEFITACNWYYNKKIKTLNNESELFRIVKHLRQYAKDNNNGIEPDIDVINNYPIIQDLICVKINKGSKGWYEKNLLNIMVKAK